MLWDPAVLGDSAAITAVADATVRARRIGLLQKVLVLLVFVGGGWVGAVAELGGWRKTPPAAAAVICGERLLVMRASSCN